MVPWKHTVYPLLCFITFPQEICCLFLLAHWCQRQWVVCLVNPTTNTSELSIETGLSLPYDQYKIWAVKLTYVVTTQRSQSLWWININASVMNFSLLQMFFFLWEIREYCLCRKYALHIFSSDVSSALCTYYCFQSIARVCMYIPVSKCIIPPTPTVW